jgi:peptidoglycan/xylan/chitin deacetylase (PgdA/CDA1 family)
VTKARRPLLSLSFDDALDSHLDLAAPLLERVGFRGTFYVHVSALPLRNRWRDWAELARRGHELGNHSLLHPAEGRKSWVTAANRIEDYSLERMEVELALANDILRMIDGRTVRSFAYPCGSNLLGREGWPRRALIGLGVDKRRFGRSVVALTPAFGSTREDFTPVVERLFFCARGGAARSTGSPIDRYHLPTLSGDGVTPAEHGALLESAATRPWSVFAWHGIGGDHGLSSTPDSFRALLERIASDERFEVKPVLEAAQELWA